jgi:hypothetical protein
VVVAILGIVSAVMAFRLGGQGERTRDSTRFAERLTNLLDRARVSAVSARANHRVRFVSPSDARLEMESPPGNWVQLERQQAGRAALLWEVRLAPNAPAAPQSLTTPTITFRPDFTTSVDDGHGTSGVSAQLYVAGLPDPTRPGRIFGPQRITVAGTGSIRLLDTW